MASATKPRLSRNSVAGATTALVLLTALNLVNYIDRYILPGVQELVKKEFRVSDSQIGSITFWFFLTYMLSAPFTGWLGDHFPRKPLLIICAVAISLVNILTGTVHDYRLTAAAPRDPRHWRSVTGYLRASAAVGLLPRRAAQSYPDDLLHGDPGRCSARLPGWRGHWLELRLAHAVLCLRRPRS